MTTDEQIICLRHWVVTDNNGSIEWRPCGPDCNHPRPERPSVKVERVDIVGKVIPIPEELKE
jgi:hypothetical protein